MKLLLLLFLIPFACAGQEVIYNTDIKKGNVNQWIYINSTPDTIFSYQIDSVNWNGRAPIQEGKWISINRGEWYCLKCGLVRNKETEYHNCTSHY